MLRTDLLARVDEYVNHPKLTRSDTLQAPRSSWCLPSLSKVAKRREGLRKQHSALFSPERDRARRRDRGTKDATLCVDVRNTEYGVTE